MNELTKAKIRSFSRLGQRATFFGIAMPEIAEQIENMCIVTADLAQLSNLIRFSEQFPDKFLNVGIAEQNMIGIASGMAMEDTLVYATTYASFIAVRDLEQIRQHISNLNLNVKLIGTAAGVVAARSGVAHWASEDVSFMRSLPNMTVMSACDGLEAYKMALFSAKYKGPMYIRLSGTPNCPSVYNEDYNFEPFKIDVLKKGKDVAIISTGLMVQESLVAAEILERKEISCTVANMHTVKPIDKETLDWIFDNHKLIVTAEEHNIIGGIGSAVAEYKTTKERMPRQIFIGIPDTFTSAGTNRYIWEKFGMTSAQIAERIINELEKHV